MKELFEKYKKLNYSISIEEERELINKYVYFTNQLEGNKLSLAQTTSILEKGLISGDNVSLRDILEHKGMEKAVFRMLKAVIDNEVLSEKLILELNWLCIGSLFKSSDSYINAKRKGQKEGEYKLTENLIKLTLPNGDNEIITPESTSKNVKMNMSLLIKRINFSQSSVIEKATFLAQEIWLHQPFIDGNKRTGRLLINFITMKEGYPLFVYSNKAKNYNSLLVEQYLYKKKGLVIDYINNELKNEMKNILSIHKKATKNKRKGFRMSIL